MIATRALDVLAERYGIEAEFIDAHGTLQHTSERTKRALLAALGVPADDDAAAQRALEVADAAPWERELPPVLVTTPERIAVPLVLPRESTDVAWELRLEDGATRSGTVDFRTLALLATKNRAGEAYECRELVLDATLEHGYHHLRLRGGAHEMALIVTPGRCWLPPSIEAGDVLGGVALQLYLLRSQTNWGIGDFSDLKAFVELIDARGGDVIGLNPVHQMFIDDPEHASPYSPASRLLLNVLNIDVAAIPEYAASATVQAHVGTPEFTVRLERCRSASLVRYSDVAQLKLEVLRLVFAAFGDMASFDRRSAFAAYRSDAGASRERSFVFSALRDHFARSDRSKAAWQSWPPEFRDPDSQAVAQFASDRARDITFIAWLQWIADAQLADAALAAESMRVGLYRDLAVGADPAGAETWINQRAVVDTARVGAPPDIYNPPGQNWDLPPFHPMALRAEAYRSFIELVRANMRHAGGLRIDHVMALQRLYWIPQGAAPADGAYVRYPIDDLIGILALESRRARCLVVGEDLGTVPEGFRERMAEANILSYRVLFFERDADDATFIAPIAYPRLALAVLGSHDLPTLRAWWTDADIALRERLGLIADGATASAQHAERASDRGALVDALRDAGTLAAQPPSAVQPRSIAAPAALDADTVYTAVHAFLARTASALAVAQIDDITGETDPVNVPTTSDEHANWRRRLSQTLEDLPADPRLAAIFHEFAAAGRLRRQT